MASVSEIQPALNALSDFLLARSYCERARVGARAYVHVHGTLADCPHVDPDDLEAATEVLVAAFPVVYPDDPSWDAEDGHWTPNDAIALYPPDKDDMYDVPDAPDHRVTLEPGYWEALEKDGILPSLAGGAPEPFEPSPEDWQSYCEWSRSLDQPSRYSPESFERIARIASCGNVD